MEEPSIHGSIGDINSAETTRSKCESVNIQLISVSSFGRRMTSLRNLLRSLRDDVTFACALALKFVLNLYCKKPLHIYGESTCRSAFAWGIRTLVQFLLNSFQYEDHFIVQGSRFLSTFRDLSKTPFFFMYFFSITCIRNDQPKSKKKKEEKCISVLLVNSALISSKRHQKQTVSLL